MRIDSEIIFINKKKQQRVSKITEFTSIIKKESDCNKQKINIKTSYYKNNSEIYFQKQTFLFQIIEENKNNQQRKIR
ncbi:unnamed protein product [Paramecium primaurelia]|uniref:Uncharacterized protein n=1 Tax=Paramecium primaurelia TaxID=5886 RepID=A0A8S1PIX5_PARPR|nr:unnamed protein product [Paramecium primaurelia]